MSVDRDDKYYYLIELRDNLIWQAHTNVNFYKEKYGKEELKILDALSDQVIEKLKKSFSELTSELEDDVIEDDDEPTLFDKEEL